MKDITTVKIGETLHISIIGDAQRHRAQVVAFDPGGYPRLKVVDDPAWENYELKQGDYIVLEDAG